ncbi:MAG: hypothetical protein R2703_16705 [Micropruina glycogenica]|jgi:hypothetical protein
MRFDNPAPNTPPVILVYQLVPTPFSYHLICSMPWGVDGLTAS